MNREIKFRAWGGKPSPKMMYQGDWFDNDNQFVGVLNGLGTLVQDRKGELLYEQCDWLTIMQYTGLKDKNGVEIYEGDTVKVFSPHDYDYDGELTTKVPSALAVVTYVAPSFHAKYVDDDLNQFVSGKSGFILEPHNEVLGNIHQNSELLEQKGE